MSDEKQCPFCAETIKAAAIKCRFCGSSLTDEAHDNQFKEDKGVRVATCPNCLVAMMSTQKRGMSSLGGFIGVIFVVIGFVLMVFGEHLVGLVLITLGIVMIFVSGKKTVMVCPSCGKEGARLA